jgi:hypothetical protein
MADDDIVTIEFRGISVDLPVGSALVVESCAAGVLRLRRLFTVDPKPDPAPAIIKPMPAAPAKEGKA